MIYNYPIGSILKKPLIYQKAPKGNESSSDHPFSGAFAVSSREGRFLVSSGQTPRNKLQVMSDQLCWDVWTIGDAHASHDPCFGASGDDHVHAGLKFELWKKNMFSWRFDEGWFIHSEFF